MNLGILVFFALFVGTTLAVRNNGTIGNGIQKKQVYKYRDEYGRYITEYERKYEYERRALKQLHPMMDI
jgi:hypothetical protein